MIIINNPSLSLSTRLNKNLNKRNLRFLNQINCRYSLILKGPYLYFLNKIIKMFKVMPLKSISNKNLRFFRKNSNLMKSKSIPHQALNRSNKRISLRNKSWRSLRKSLYQFKNRQSQLKFKNQRLKSSKSQAK